MTDLPQIVRPKNLRELLNCLRQSSRVRFIAGMTDLMVRGRDGLREAELLADLSTVQEMKGIEIDGAAGVLRLGAAETLASVAANPFVLKQAEALAQAAAGIGSVQIRNRATLGGNVANASPAADTMPALACLAAVCVVSGREGRRRTCPVSEIIGNIDKNTLADGEFILEFHIPLKPGRYSVFGKVGSREFVSISRLNMAMTASRAINGAQGLSVWVGTLGPTPRRAALDGLCGENSKERAEAFKNALARLVDESIPGRHSQTYKRSAVQGLGETLLKRLQDKMEVTVL